MRVCLELMTCGRHHSLQWQRWVPHSVSELQRKRNNWIREGCYEFNRWTWTYLFYGPGPSDRNDFRPTFKKTAINSQKPNYKAQTGQNRTRAFTSIKLLYTKPTQLVNRHVLHSLKTLKPTEEQVSCKRSRENDDRWRRPHGIFGYRKVREGIILS